MYTSNNLDNYDKGKLILMLQAVAYPEFSCYLGTRWACTMGSPGLRNPNVVHIKLCICTTSFTAFVIKA